MAQDKTFPAFTRDKFIPLFDANTVRKLTGFGTPSTGLDLTRINKSTVFELAFNPQEETYQYIDSANDETSITSYQPSMDQEILVDGNNECYALLYEYAIKFPIGTEAVVPIVLVAPSVTDPDVNDALLWSGATLVCNTLNTQEKKLTFKLNLNGDHERGTATIADGKVTYVAPGQTESLQALSANVAQAQGAKSGKSDE